MSPSIKMTGYQAKSEQEIIQRKIMQSCKWKISLGPALLPFCILQTPLGKPKKLCRVCKANGLLAYKTSYKRRIQYLSYKSQKVSHGAVLLFECPKCALREPRAISHSGDGPHPSTRGSHHHFVFVASFCLFVSRETGAPPSPPFLHSNISS